MLQWKRVNGWLLHHVCCAGLCAWLEGVIRMYFLLSAVCFEYSELVGIELRV